MSLHKTLVTPDSGICNVVIKLTQPIILYTTSVYVNLSTEQRINVRGRRFQEMDIGSSRLFEAAVYGRKWPNVHSVYDCRYGKLSSDPGTYWNF